MAAETTTWFVVLTVMRPIGNGGFATSTVAITADVGPTATRQALYKLMLKQLPPEFEGASVMHFSAEPNQIGGER